MFLAVGALPRLLSSLEVSEERGRLRAGGFFIVLIFYRLPTKAPLAAFNPWKVLVLFFLQSGVFWKKKLGEFAVLWFFFSVRMVIDRVTEMISNHAASKGC